MLIEALFTIAKTYKQPKHPVIDEQTQKMWYIQTMEYYSAINRTKVVPFAATWMQLEILILSEISEIPYDITYMQNLKYGTNDPIYKTETDQGHGDQTRICQGAGMGGSGMDWEFGVGWQMQTTTFRMDK